jgi:hypothetical protein
MKALTWAALTASVVWLGISVPAVHAQVSSYPSAAQARTPAQWCAHFRGTMLNMDAMMTGIIVQTYQSIVCDDGHHTVIITLTAAFRKEGMTDDNRRIIAADNMAFNSIGYTVTWR